MKDLILLTIFSLMVCDLYTTSHDEFANTIRRGQGFDDSINIKIIDTVDLSGYLLEWFFDTRSNPKALKTIKQKLNIDTTLHKGSLSFFANDTNNFSEFVFSKNEGYFFLDPLTFDGILKCNQDYVRFTLNDTNYPKYKEFFFRKENEAIHMSEPISATEDNYTSRKIYTVRTSFYKLSVKIFLLKKCFPGIVIPKELIDDNNIIILTPF